MSNSHMYSVPVPGIWILFTLMHCHSISLLHADIHERSSSELLLQSAILRYLNFNANQHFISSLAPDVSDTLARPKTRHEVDLNNVRPFAAEYLFNILESTYPEMSFIFIRDDFRLRTRLLNQDSPRNPNEDADNYEIFLQCEKRKNFYFINMGDIYRELEC